MTEPRSLKDFWDAIMDAALKDFEGDNAPVPGEPLTARKLSHHTQVSCCVLTDMDMTGENHCKHPLPELKPRPWTWRLYDWWWDLRERTGRRVAGWRWPEDAE